MSAQDLLALQGMTLRKLQVLQSELGIHSLQDLLLYFPYRHIDRSEIMPIASITDSTALAQVRGTLGPLKVEGQGKSYRLSSLLADKSGVLQLTWFAGIDALRNILKPGQEYLCFGKTKLFQRKPSMSHPELQLVAQQDPTKRLAINPVYSTTEKAKKAGLDSRSIQMLVEQALKRSASAIEEIIPEPICKHFQLLPRSEAVLAMHSPDSFEKLSQAQFRLKFEELFLMQYELLQAKQQRKLAFKGLELSKIDTYFNTFYSQHLPFQLTGAQKRVLKEIRQDVRSGRQMNRLVQGDVGSGKTMVAFMTMLMAIDNDYQACYMAPTEILANQHYQNFLPFAAKLGINVRLITGNTKAGERKRIKYDLENGFLHILVGTHALLEDWIQFPSLGMIIIDEQHRFGVAQRAKLWKGNGIPPHVLVMTATPIPRTLAMSLYGDLDVSVIDELPPGRTPVVTRQYKSFQWLMVLKQIKDAIALGRQVYVVFPLIEDSETLDLLSLTQGFDNYSRYLPEPEYRIGVLHGRMDPDAKRDEMLRFKQGFYHLLLSTTVIEVGVDVPNASLMIIENAERFGLSQLHQLRGRVGRGANESACILKTADNISQEAQRRIDAMCSTNDGFKLAELDMEIRGPGDIAGTRQSGDIELKVADLSTDLPILQASRQAATAIVNADVELQLPENQCLANYLTRSRASNNHWSFIS